jgi:hypothetical protein
MGENAFGIEVNHGEHNGGTRRAQRGIEPQRHGGTKNTFGIGLKRRGAEHADHWCRPKRLLGVPAAWDV